MSDPIRERREKSLVKLIELHAPPQVLAMACHNLLGTYEGSEWRAIRRWAWWRIQLGVICFWDSLRMRVLIHLLRMSPARAADLVFGSDDGDY